MPRFDKSKVMDIKLQILILSAIYFSMCKGTQKHMLRPKQKISVKCSKCPPGWGVVKQCNKYNDTICKLCKTGESYSPYYSSKSPCWPCSQCGVGLYEAHKCSPAKDTICNECTAYIGHKNFMMKNDFSQKCSYLFLS